MAKKRRGRGEGSVFKIGPSLWRAQISLTRDGKQVRKSVYGKTKAEALEKLAALRLKYGQQLPARVILGQYLRTWLLTRKGHLKDTTHARYQQLLSLHIEPYPIALMPLEDLRPMHLEAHYADLMDAGASSRTAVMVRNLLRAALKKAVNQEMVPRNVAEISEAPKHRYERKRVPTQDEIVAFLEAASGHKLFGFFLLAIDTGMRKGELLGLQWADVDLEARTIRVHQQLVEIRGEPLRLASLKTSGSERVVSISGHAAKALAAIPRDSEFVFTSRSGGPYYQSYLSKVFYGFLEKAGLPKTSFHAFTRHAHATLLLKHNVNLKLVSQRLGHASVATTANIYQHVLRGMQQPAVDAMEEVYSHSDSTPHES